MLKCTRENHHESQIIRLCLSKSCKQKRKACFTCWKELHGEHQGECMTFPFIKLILLHENNILQKLQEETQKPQLLNIEKIQLFNELLTRTIKQINKIIENLSNQEYSEIDFIITFCVKIHDRLLEQELMHYLLVEFRTSYEELLADIFKKKLKQYYEEDDENYEFEKLNFKAIDLLKAQKYLEAYTLFDTMFQKRPTEELSRQKRQCILFHRNREEAIKIFSKEDCQDIMSDLLKNQGLQTELIELLQNPFIGWLKILLPIVYPLINTKELVNSPAFQSFNHNAINEQTLIQITQTSFRIQQLIQSDNYEEALDYIDQIIDLSRAQPEVVQQQLRKQKDYLQLKIKIKESKQIIMSQDQKDDNYYFIKGHRLFQIRQFEESLECFQQISNNFSLTKDVEEMKRMALICLQKNNQALSTVGTQSYLCQCDIYFNILIDVALINQSKFDQAIQLIQNNLKKYPKSILLWKQQCDCLLLKEQFEQAHECLLVAQGFHPNNILIKVFQSQCLFQSKKWKEAIQIADEVIITQKFQLEAFELKAKSLYNLNEIEESYKFFEQLCALAPNNRAVRINKNYLLLMKQNYNDSLREFQKLLEFDQTDFSILYYTGVALFYLEKWEESSKILEKIIPFNNSRIFYVLCLAKSQMLNQAQSFIENHLKQYQETDSLFFLIQCEILIKLQKYDQAFKIYETEDEIILNMTACSQFCIKNYLKVGMTLIELNQYQRASQILSKSYQDNFQLTLIYGYLLELNCNYEEALFLYDQSIYQTENAVALNAKVNLLNQLQRNNEASEISELLKAFFPNYKIKTQTKDVIYDLILFDYKPDINSGDIVEFEFKTSTYLTSQYEDNDTKQLTSEIIY